MSYPSSGGYQPTKYPGLQHPLFYNAASQPTFLPAHQCTFGEQHSISQGNSESIPSTHYVRMLELELDVARKRIQEYEAAIANFVSQTFLVRNQSHDISHAFPPTYSSVDKSRFDLLRRESANKEPHRSQYDPGVHRTLEVKLIRTIEIKSAFRVKFSPDGQLLAIAPVSWKYPVSIFNLSTGEKICVLEDLYLRESSCSTVDLYFSPNGKYLATSMSKPENIIKIWEVGKRRVRNVLKGHHDFVHALDFSPNGRLLLSGSNDRTVRIWNMRDGSSRIFYEDEYHFCSICSSTDGKYVAAGTFGGHVLIWELRSGHLVALLNGHTNLVEGSAFMPNSNGLITASWDGTLKYWDIVSSRTPNKQNDRPANAVEQKGNLTLVGHTAAVRSISISPDGQWLVSGSKDKTAFIWSTNTWTQHCVLEGHKSDVVSVDFSPVGGYLASTDLYGKVLIWSYKLV